MPEAKKPRGASTGRGGLGGGPGSGPKPPAKGTKPRGIGRGLEAILAASPAPGGGAAPEAEAELREVLLTAVSANPDQPRRRFDPDELQALADSITSQGILQPVLVRPRPGGRLEIVAGERRWRAAQLAGVETIPVVVRERTEAETLEAALVENMARADLTPIEEARAVAGLVEELGLTREDVARRVGRSRSAVSNLIRLLDLPDDVIELLEERQLTEGHGRALLLAPDHADRRSLARAAVAEGWSVREVERRARPAGEAGSKPQPAKPATASSDHVEAADSLADELAARLGLDVKVKPHAKGFKVEFVLDDAEAAGRLTDRLG